VAVGEGEGNHVARGRRCVNFQMGLRRSFGLQEKQLELSRGIGEGSEGEK